MIWLFSVSLTSGAGVQALQLRAADSEAVGRLALTVAARKGWQGASVLDCARLYRVSR